MANTYTQIYIHYVFAVQNRICLIRKNWKTDLYKYMNGIIEQQGHKPFAINGVAEHVHVLVSMNPKQAPSDLMYHVKRSSSKWINENRLAPGRFSWQEGFGAFTCGKSQLSDVVSYIENQEQHHSRKNFIEEYKELLETHEVDYDERYVFSPIE